MAQTINSTTTLYTNNEAVTFEMTALQTALQDAKAVKQYLTDKEVLTNASTIEQACKKSFGTIINNFIEVENNKLKDFEAKFGVLSLLTGNSEGRLRVAAEALQVDLLAGLPKLDYYSPTYWNCIDFESMTIKTEFNQAYFEQKNSIIVPTETAKHQKNLVEALNYFLDLYSDWNITVILDRLIKRKEMFGRDIETNLDAFDLQKNVRDFVSHRVNEKNNRNRY